MRVLRGHIWSVSLDPTVPNEQDGANEERGTRPCLVASADRFNSLPIRQAIVVPLTTRDRGFPHHVVVVVDDGGLPRESWAMCEAVRAVSTQRFGRLIGTAEKSTVDQVLAQLGLWLS